MISCRRVVELERELTDRQIAWNEQRATVSCWEKEAMPTVERNERFLRIPKDPQEIQENVNSANICERIRMKVTFLCSPGSEHSTHSKH